jgi:3-hydroxyisobutyrate dehydrogenase
MTTVGFIGLGNMGGPMARNLINAGHSLKVYDLDEDKVHMLVQAGATRAQSVAEAAAGVEMVVTMVPEGRHVRDAFLGEGGIIAAADPGTLVIDSSTIDVATAQAVHEAAAEAGFEMVDAPVSGGTIGAENATLTFMCGGKAGAVAKARPLLESMGKNIVHAGSAGLGQAAKICNNMLAGISAVAVAEAFVLGEHLGLDAQTLYDIVSTSSGQCFFLTSNCPVPGPVPTASANRDFEPGFMAKLMAKDLRLAQSASIATGVATPLGAQASALFNLFETAGFGDKDTAAIIKLIRGEMGK